MQVERQRGGNSGGERRTGEEFVGICLFVGDNVGKLTLIPHNDFGPKIYRRGISPRLIS